MQGIQPSEPNLGSSHDEGIESQFAELRRQVARAEEEAAAAGAALAAQERQCDRANQELRDCARQLAGLRDTIDHANVPIVGIDRLGLVVEWNRKAAEVFCCEGQTAMRRSLADWLPKADRGAFGEFEAAALRAAGRGEPTSSFQRHFRLSQAKRCRDQSESWHEVLFSASPRFSGGSGDGVLYVLQDVSEPRRKQSEAELAVEDLTRLIQTVNAPIIGVDPKGIVEEWNCKAEMLTGFPREEAIGKSLVQNFITAEFADSVQLMISQALLGQEITNYEFSLFTKAGQRREILWSATARRNRKNEVVGVIGVGQDITELRSESKMLANYVRICGAAVWSLRGNAMTGVVTDSKTKEIEHLISQQAQMDVCDPRMVLWRASFVSILKTMCQNFWMRRKGAQGLGEKGGTAVSTDFGYEFCFEAPNGSVKWYKVQGHLIQECLTGSQFEVTGSMQEVTSMLIDKVMGDRWQKWWNRMCHMVFDATLLVDTQEYRVLNAWGEEKVFGCKLQSHHPLLHLIKPEDTVSLKEAFNEVTFKGFERGRTLHLLRSGCDEDMPAQCFLLSADQENPNECMMGIRMQDADNVSVLWDVAKPNPVLTLEDLARWKSGLKRSHRRPSRNVRSVHRIPPHRSRSSDPHTSSHSLSSIPEDLHGEFEEDDLRLSDRGRPSDSGSDRDAGSEGRDSVAEDTESLQSSSKSSTSSKSSNGDSEVGVCNSSPARSAIEELGRGESGSAQCGFGTIGDSNNPFSLSPKLVPGARSPTAAQQARWRMQARSPIAAAPPVRAKPAVRVGPPLIKLRWSGRSFDLNLDNFTSFCAFSAHIAELTGVPPNRQTLILAGRRLPVDDAAVVGPGELKWSDLKADVRPNQVLMMVGRVPSETPNLAPGKAASKDGPSGGAEGSGDGTATSEDTAEVEKDLEVLDV